MQMAARFNWLYHDTATYAPYTAETAHVPSLLLGRKCGRGPPRLCPMPCSGLVPCKRSLSRSCCGGACAGCSFRVCMSGPQPTPAPCERRPTCSRSLPVTRISCAWHCLYRPAGRSGRRLGHAPDTCPSIGCDIAPALHMPASTGSGWWAGAAGSMCRPPVSSM